MHMHIGHALAHVVLNLFEKVGADWDRMRVAMRPYLVRELWQCARLESLIRLTLAIMETPWRDYRWVSED